ncbi:MAG: serine/threonine protein kinase [Phycisphaerae bacterium]|nr:serine/threonine protein kinase [Phycisphaerae bacterium]
MAFAFKHGDRPLEGHTIQRAVGRGGFGEVYYAISDGGREVALKYLRENPQVELRGVSHCINLKSPHLVTIFDVRKNADGEYFIIMEYVGGPSLRDLLVAEPNGLGVQKAAFFLRELAKGLSYLHDRGIVHRDLKPGNVFYDDGYVKIGDYGLSKFISVSRHSVQTTSVGTVHYMAPEVGSGHYSRGIDIYALGVMLYEMLLGRVPFEGGSMGEVLMKHLTAQPSVDELPEPFAHVIRKALAKDPNERYQTVDEMVQEIFDVSDVQQSLAGFNPTSLTQAAGRAAADIAASPVPSPNPPPFYGRPAGPPAGVPMRVSRRLARVEEKVARKMAALDRKAGIPPQRPTVAPPQYAARPTSVKGVVLAIIIALAVSIAGGVICGNAYDEETGVAAFFATLLASAGLALAQRVQRWIGEHAEPEWVQHLLCAVCCAPAVLIGAVAMSECRGVRDDDVLGWLAGVGLMIVGVDWRKRFRAGTTGQLGIASALFTGFLAFIVAVVVSQGEDDAMWLAGGFVVAICLIVQATAWFWPALGLPVFPKDAVSLARPEPPREPAPPQAATAPPPAVEELPYGVPVEPSGRPTPEAATEPLPPLRWGVTRAAWSVLAFCLFGAAVVLFLIPVLGMAAHEDEAVMAGIGCAGAVAFMFMAISKTTERRRPGFWRETARPFLLAVTATGLVACIAIQTTENLCEEEQLAFLSITIICAGLLLVAAFVGRRKRRRSVSGLWAIPVVLLILALSAAWFTIGDTRPYDAESPSSGWSDSGYDLPQRRFMDQRVTELQAYVSDGVARTRADVQHVRDVTNLNPRPFRYRQFERVRVFLLIGPAVLVLGLLAVMRGRRPRRSRNLFGPHHSPHHLD